MLLVTAILAAVALASVVSLAIVVVAAAAVLSREHEHKRSYSRELGEIRQGLQALALSLEDIQTSLDSVDTLQDTLAQTLGVWRSPEEEESQGKGVGV
jgi:hypothetical protein